MIDRQREEERERAGSVSETAAAKRKTLGAIRAARAHSSRR
jgi:hypothetical protein